MSTLTMREALESAYDKHDETEDESGETSQAGGSQENSSQSMGDTETVSDASDVPSLAESGETDETGEREAAAAAQLEEEAPRNTKKQGKQNREDATAEPAIKAPTSWKPQFREEWKKLSAGAQAEITRRERETNVVLSQSADARRFNDEFVTTIRPFEGMLSSMRVSPMQAVRDLMTTAGGLVMGTPVQKAHIVAEVIRNYGVDIQHLDKILAGQQVKDTNNNPEMNRALQQQLQPMQDFMNRQNQQEQQQMEQAQSQADNAVEYFGSQVEYFEDLREDMADLMEQAKRRGRNMNLAQAYHAAALSHPEISKLVKGRVSANATAQSIDGKRKAASSLRGGAPNGGKIASPADLRGAIASAYEKHAR